MYNIVKLPNCAYIERIFSRAGVPVPPSYGTDTLWVVAPDAAEMHQNLDLEEMDTWGILDELDEVGLVRFVEVDGPKDHFETEPNAWNIINKFL